MKKLYSKMISGSLYSKCQRCGNLCISLEECGGKMLCVTCRHKVMEEEKMIEDLAKRAKELGGG